MAAKPDFAVMPYLSNIVRSIPPALALFVFATAAWAEPIREAWNRRYDGPVAGADYAVGVAADADGNVAVVGRSNGSGTAIDFYTAKYAVGTGAIVWERRYATSSNDVPAAIAFDPSGNVIVTGYTGAAGVSDIYTAKYAADDGALLWQRTYNGPANGADRAQALAIDSAGNVIITGSSVNGGAGDYYTAKYAASNGALIWERRYDGPANGADAAEAVAVDGAGNVFVTGGSVNGTSSDIYTAKYAAANGAIVWEKRYNGTGNGVDAGHAIAIDAVGNAIVTGYSAGATTNQDIYTAKYAAVDGALRWERRYDGGLGAAFDEGWAVGVDAAGDVFITGASESASNTSDFYTAKYSATTGAVLWERRYNGPGNGTDRASSLAMSSSGDVFVTGTASAASGYDDIYTAKYAGSDGAILWEQTYDGPAHLVDSAHLTTPYAGKIAATPEGGVVVAGQSQAHQLPDNYDFITVQYSPPPAAPTVVTGNAGTIGPNSATVQATTIPNFVETNVWFEYGTSTSYGKSTSAASVGDGFLPVPFIVTFSRLLPETEYHYRIVAQNSLGTIYGLDRTFTTLVQPPDTDHDGMSDAWETAHGLNPNDPNDAALDSDGDGQTNLAEFVAGTDPQAIGSFLHLDMSSDPDTGDFLISFTAQAGKAYTVQYLDDLASGDWQSFADIPAFGSTLFIEMADTPAGIPHRFYRVVTPPVQ